MELETIREITERKMFTNVFQPIYHLPSQTIVGYESLLRCPLIKSPDLLFDAARKQGYVHELDMASIANSIQTFDLYYQQNYVNDLFLAVNVYPSTMSFPFFPQFLEKIITKTCLSNRQIILEINESEPLKDISKIMKNISSLKEKGFIIALDDLGTGEHSLYTLLEIEPDVIKFDNYLAKDLSSNPKKQKVLTYFLDFFDNNKKIILEGIETKEDMLCAQKIGVPYAQGYYLSKPHLLHISC
ncbi:EAL domain-containing protein (putative c-di-GMP-specific phosphodiesterase class I) [Anoxybacillus voinovskiensis]|uniref:EAL domain-containing protein (Putative c-di-GMP-specific phosphodiesterase class I) n=1 Tax=Anoxybacteroides voinovskiense TaxID=230470 RepID=A0A840DPK3_9BACL|nr:EAL domain-containing protein [Anoxybacillus voinovskiensis]MBB4073442.1 EAL domain-containing protein (putative c-di-GMP-specific phosphodiesterase class I) [Anoxybacillus voinovskiensis]GGJ61145.1 hypothetical protein GCM10008982_07870 [Anoxybacillus voinovskiensis]